MQKKKVNKCSAMAQSIWIWWVPAHLLLSVTLGRLFKHLWVVISLVQNGANNDTECFLFVQRCSKGIVSVRFVTQEIGSSSIIHVLQQRMLERG